MSSATSDSEAILKERLWTMVRPPEYVFLARVGGRTKRVTRARVGINPLHISVMGHEHRVTGITSGRHLLWIQEHHFKVVIDDNA